MSDRIKIYTDGACSGNPGNGGWGAVLLYKEHEKRISGKKNDTTNNQMELTAVIESLKIVKKSSQITIYSDSKYVIDGITKWIFSWKKNSWKGANKQLIKNVELWQSLVDETAKHEIEWIWVKGHSGNHYNEIADMLAQKASKEFY
jgi:ribonuclease HI